MFELIADIANRVKVHFPELTKGAFIARKDKEGRILQQQSEMNEFTPSGIDDRSNDYYYIRHRETGRFTYEPTEEGRYSSCERVQNVRGEFRLVIVTDKVNPYAFEDRAARALISLHKHDRSGKRNIEIEIVETEIDSITVATQETPGETVKDFDPKLNFYAIDFNVSFVKVELTVPGPLSGAGVSVFNKYSMLYDGIDEYIDYGAVIASGVDFDAIMGAANAQFTFSLWVNGITQAGRVILCRYDNVGAGRQLFRLLIDGSGFSQFYINYTTGGTSYVGAVDLRGLTGWNNLIYTYDGSLPVLNRMNFYINGVPDTITPVDFGGAGTIQTNGTVPFFIGAQQDSITPPAGAFSDGYRDEISFFDTALTAPQRSELYNSGNPNNLLQHSAAANLKFWDRQGDTGTYLIAINELGGTGGTVENMEPEDITNNVP